jgi:hypothetical protein
VARPFERSDVGEIFDRGTVPDAAQKYWKRLTVPQQTRGARRLGRGVATCSPRNDCSPARRRTTGNRAASRSTSARIARSGQVPAPFRHCDAPCARGANGFGGNALKCANS